MKISSINTTINLYSDYTFLIRLNILGVFQLSVASIANHPVILGTNKSRALIAALFVVKTVDSIQYLSILLTLVLILFLFLSRRSYNWEYY